MARQITQPLLNTSPTPLDAKKGPFIGATEGDAINAALAAIPEHGRHLGLTVILIINGGDAEEYWFKSSVGTLVKKNTATLDEVAMATDIDVTNVTDPIQTAGISARLVLETNKAITRDFNTLRGQTINVNTAGIATGDKAHLLNFINAIFFPFIPHTLSCNVSGALTREVGDTTAVTITATLTRNNNSVISARQLFVHPAGEGQIEIVGAYSGDTWSNTDPNPGSYGNKVVTYKAKTMINVDDAIPPTEEPIEATKAINYIFPVFIGKSANKVETGATLLTLIGNGTALKKLTNSTFSTSGNESIIMSANDGTYKFIAVPAAKSVTAFSSGLDGGVIPSASPTGTFQAADIHEDDFVSEDFGWGVILGGVPYKIYNTQHKVGFDEAGVTFTLV